MLVQTITRQLAPPFEDPGRRAVVCQPIRVPRLLRSQVRSAGPPADSGIHSSLGLQVEGNNGMSPQTHTAPSAPDFGSIFLGATVARILAKRASSSRSSLLAQRPTSYETTAAEPARDPILARHHRVTAYCSTPPQALIRILVGAYTLQSWAPH